MGHNDKSLFSLELVVEKLYIPNVVCRFPAVAFRLLDFPTIVIKHVEDDLGRAIRQKISFDPSYQLPLQFIELKDKLGNFMVKKGKSCLFTMQPEALRHHLTSTPLYVMVIDLFPETPKLVANSTVPLDSTMDQICSDITKFGLTVPSVHGDKGLFKLYNLMGKEVGYFILGFRLLCLGPGMIQHLPESALLQRRTTPKQQREEIKVNNLLANEQLGDENDESDKSVVELRNSACMTDPIKHDMYIQTMELEDKAVHVAFSTSDKTVATIPVGQFITQSEAKETQTEKRKSRKDVLNENIKWVEAEDLRVEDDGPIINNIICPPPLFYNSCATPAIGIERNQSIDDPSWEVSSVGDLSELDSFSGQGIESEKKKTAQVDSDIDTRYPSVDNLQKNNFFSYSRNDHYKVPAPKARQNEIVKGLNVVPQADAVFPLLTALIQELSCVQNPNLLLGVSQKIEAAQRKVHASSQAEKPPKKEPAISPSAVSAVAAALSKKNKSAKVNVEGNESSRQNVSKQAKSENKAGLSSSNASRRELVNKPKKKLVYGMTNTQRLRLQKTNPMWLKNVEKEAAASAKPPPSKTLIKPGGDDLDSTNFSDTLTEVRRLAEIEMNSTAGGDTIRQVAGESEEKNSVEKMKTYSKNEMPSSKLVMPNPVKLSRKSPPRAIRHSPSANSGRKDSEVVSKSRSQGSLSRSSPFKPRSRMRHRRSAHKELIHSSDSDEIMAKRRPVPLARHIKPSSLELEEHRNSIGDMEDGLSGRSDVPSSRSRSIDVHLPSAERGADDNATLTDDEEYNREKDIDDDDYADGAMNMNVDNADDDSDDIPLPDDSTSEMPKVQVLNFPRYVSRDISLPASIEGVPNASLYASGVMDENSPLESTRQSKNMTEDQNDSRVLHSTDFDTRQFHSTDEPELQGLISEEDILSERVESGRRSVASVRTSQKFPVINPQMSENSPVPSIRRSTTKLDTGHSYLPSMSMSKGYTSPVSSRPSTPKDSTPRKKKEFEPLIPGKEGKRVRGSITPRTASASPRRPTPMSRRAALDMKTSIHTDSLSSYMPSDPENVLVSLSSNSGNYSDDFVQTGSGESVDASSNQLPKLIPAAKLGFTIN